MASVLKLFHDILCKLRSTRCSVGHFFRRWALFKFLAFLSRRLGVWRPWDDRKGGTFPRVEQAQRSFPCTGAGLDLRECVVAASYIPASATRSASQPSLHSVSSVIQQAHTATASDAPLTPASSLAGSLRRRDHINSLSVFDARIDLSRRSTIIWRSSSVASDRPSIIQSHSRESLPMPTGQPTPFPRAPHRQFGRGPSLPPSRESSRSPSPTPQLPGLETDFTISHPRTQSPHRQFGRGPSLPPSRESSRSPSPTPQLSSFEFDFTIPDPQTQDDRRNSSVIPPSITSHGHAQPTPPSIHGHRRRQSSTSVVVGVVNPSTDSLPPRFFTDGPLLTEEPYTIGSPTDSTSGHLSVPDIDLHEGLPLTNLDLPDGRVLLLMNSEQVPRYTKEVTVQVDYITTNIKPLSLWAGPAKELSMRFHL